HAVGRYPGGDEDEAGLNHGGAAGRASTARALLLLIWTRGGRTPYCPQGGAAHATARTKGTLVVRQRCPHATHWPRGTLPVRHLL
ncbi:hypothetical protein Dimus_023022, partial [Dionaea muscipula]